MEASVTARRDPWSPGPRYAFTCRCGIRLLASDQVELEWLKGEHFDFHAEQGETW